MVLQGSQTWPGRTSAVHRAGVYDPLKLAQKWGDDATLTPINTSPLIPPLEGTGFLATLGGWAESCD